MAAAAAILLLFFVFPATIVISAQTSTNASNAVNTITSDSSNNTMIPSMQKICPAAESNDTGQSQPSSSSTTEMSNNTANTGAASSSNRTMQGRPNPNNTTSNTADNNIPTPSGGNLSAIGRSIGQARTDLIEGCNAVNNGDSSLALMHLNLVARALDNIEGNLSSSRATEGGGITTNLPPTGGTSTSSVEGATAGDRSGS